MRQEEDVEGGGGGWRLRRKDDEEEGGGGAAGCNGVRSEGEWHGSCRRMWPISSRSSMSVNLLYEIRNGPRTKQCNSEAGTEAPGRGATASL